MESKKAIAIAALIALLVAGLIVGIIMYLTSFFSGATTSTSGRNVITSSPNPLATPTPAPQTGGQQQQPTPQNNAVKTVTVGGVTFSYPSKWGTLRCNNSQNVEFDPYNSVDQTMRCDVAVKPITVLVGGAPACAGEPVTLGNARVIRSKVNTNMGTEYRWCVSGVGNNFDITHRVSSTSARANSRDDFSQAIEQMISNIRVGGGS